MQIAYGTYTGNGTSQDITGPGWAADFVWIKGGSSIAQLWTSTMGATSCKPATGSTALDTTTGVSQHASGFTVAGNAAINTNAATYYYLAIRDNGIADFQVGSYTGNGSDNRDLALLDFDPNAVFVMSAGADPVAMRLSTMTGDQSCVFNGALSANLIQNIITNGWQTGNSTTVNNADARTYYYVAAKNSTLLHVIDDASNRSYVGDGTDSRTITGAGFTPDAFALVKAATSIVATARFGSHAGDQSADVDAASSTSADRIQAFAADGFEVGTATRVNTNGTNYHAIVMKAGTVAAPSGKPFYIYAQQ
jgi:hypothetical protein